MFLLSCYRYGNIAVDPIIITEPHFHGNGSSYQFPNDCPFVDPNNMHVQEHGYVGGISYEQKSSVIDDITDEMLNWFQTHGQKRRKSYV